MHVGFCAELPHAFLYLVWMHLWYLYELTQVIQWGWLSFSSYGSLDKTNIQWGLTHASEYCMGSFLKCSYHDLLNLVQSWHEVSRAQNWRAAHLTPEWWIAFHGFFVVVFKVFAPDLQCYPFQMWSQVAISTVVHSKIVYSCAGFIKGSDEPCLQPRGSRG